MRLLLILILAFVLRIVNLNQSFWLDEAAQVIESGRSLSQQLDIVSDFHPPLFHLLLHFWMYFGRTEAWIRLLSVLFALGSIVLLYQLALHFGKKQEGLLAAFFLTLSPYHLWYSQEARPYVLFVFVSLFSTLMLVKKRWLFYTFAAALSLYSLYFAPFLLLAHGFYIWFYQKKELRQFLISLISAAIFFSPWFPLFADQLRVGTGHAFSGWTEIVSVSPLKGVPLTFAKFIYGRGSIENNLIYGGVILPVLMIFLISVLKLWKSRQGKILIILFGMPFVTSIVFSFFIPIFAPQRFIFLLPIFFLIIAKGIFNLFTKTRIVMVMVVSLTSMAGIADYYTSPYVQREQWRQAVAFVEEKENKEAVALFVFPDPFAPYLWYKKDKVEALGIAPKFILKDEDLKNLSPKLTNKKRVYLFQYLTDLTDPKEKTKEFLESQGFKEKLIKDFPGVGFVYVYEKI